MGCLAAGALMSWRTGARAGATIVGGIGLALAVVILGLSWLLGGSAHKQEFLTTDLPSSILLFGLSLGVGAILGSTIGLVVSRFRR
jgi:hypothetical protein